MLLVEEENRIYMNSDNVYLSFDGKVDIFRYYDLYNKI